MSTVSAIYEFMDPHLQFWL